MQERTAWGLGRALLPCPHKPVESVHDPLVGSHSGKLAKLALLGVVYGFY